MIETEQFKSMKYIDNDSLTLIDIGLIGNINVVDLRKTDMDDTIKKIYNPRIFNENDNDKYNNHLRNVIIPQLKLVDGLYDIEKLNKITDFDLNIDTKFNSITFFNSLLSDNKTKFTNF